MSDGSAFLSPASVPSVDYPARDLALPALHAELRDVEDLLAERGLDISYETVRRWVLKFGPLIARKLRQRRPRPSDRWHLDEMSTPAGLVRILDIRQFMQRGTSETLRGAGRAMRRIAVDLAPGSAQTRHTVHFHRVTPREELVDRQGIAAANLFQSDHAAEHRLNDHGLASRDPALRIGRRQFVGRSLVRGKVWCSIGFPRIFALLSIANSPQNAARGHGSIHADDRGGGRGTSV